MYKDLYIRHMFRHINYSMEPQIDTDRIFTHSSLHDFMTLNYLTLEKIYILGDIFCWIHVLSFISICIYYFIFIIHYFYYTLKEKSRTSN